MRSGGRRDLQGDASFAQKAKLLLVGFIVTCSGSWHFGWQISIINPLADILQVFITKSLERFEILSLHFIIIISIFSHLDTKLKKWVLHLLWPTVAGLLFIGAFCGAMISSNIIKKFGLRKSFLISSIIICISLLMAFTSKLLFSAELLILHRFINGVGVGLITTAQTVYLAEITPSNIINYYVQEYYIVYFS
jgi:MFS family permease